MRWLPAVLVLGILSFARLPWTSSFWLDETVSIWVAQGSFEQTTERASYFQGQSPLYFWIVNSILASGDRAEWLLRLPSLVFFLLGLWALYGISRRYLDETWRFVPLAICLSADTFLKSAVQVRPYGAALCFGLGSVYFFIRWIESRNVLLLCGSALTFVAMFYFHYLFLPLGIVHIALLVWSSQEIRKSTSAALQLLVVAIGTGAAMIPGFLQMASLQERRETLQFVQAPSFKDYLFALIPPYWIVFIVMALVLVRIFGPFGWARARVHERGLGALLVWWLFAPSFLLFVSYASNGVLFVDRYYAWSIAGFAILLACVLHGIEPAVPRNRAMGILFVLMICRAIGLEWRTEDWREASRFVAATPAKNIWLWSGLVESEQVEWLRDATKMQYLSSPLRVYPVPQEVRPIPSDFEREESQAFGAEMARTINAEGGGYLAVLAIKRRDARGEWHAGDDAICANLESNGIECELVWPAPGVRPIVEVFELKPRSD